VIIGKMGIVGEDGKNLVVRWGGGEVGRGTSR